MSTLVSKIDRYCTSTIFVLLSLLLFFPLVVTHSSLYPFIVGKGFFILIVTSVVAIIWLLQILITKKTIAVGSIALSLVVFLVVLVISNTLGIHSNASFFGEFARMNSFVLLLQLFILFLVIRNTLRDDKKKWYWLCNISVGVSMLVAVVALYQWLPTLSTQPGRISGTIGNPIFIASYAMTHLFVTALVLRLQPIKKPVLYFAGTSFVLNGLIVFLSASRGVFIGVIISCLVMVLLALYKSRASFIEILKKYKIFIIAVLVLIAGCIFLVQQSTFSYFDRLSFSTTIEHSNSRVLLWQNALDAFSDKPIFGWGQNSFRTADTIYASYDQYQYETWNDSAHNIVLDWLVQSGLLGLLAYLSVLVLALLVLWKRAQFSNYIKIVVTGFLVAYFVQNIFVFDIPQTYLYYFIILALIESHTRATSVPFYKHRVVSVLGGLVFISLMLVVHLPTFAATFYTRLAHTVVDVVEGSLVEHHDNGLLDNIELYKKALDSAFFGHSAIQLQLLDTANIANSIQGLDTNLVNEITDYAIEEGYNNIQNNPYDVGVKMRLALFLSDQGMVEEAKALMHEALELAPNKLILWEALLTILLHNKEFEIAQDVSATLLDRTQGNFKVWQLHVLSLAGQGKVELVKGEIQKMNASGIAVNMNELLGAFELYGVDISPYTNPQE